MEVIKIRLQAQHHSMADPLDIPKYRNAAHALYTVIKEEGVGALYRGVSLTALRQGTYVLNISLFTPLPQILPHQHGIYFPLRVHFANWPKRLESGRKLHRIH